MNCSLLPLLVITLSATAAGTCSAAVACAGVMPEAVGSIVCEITPPGAPVPVRYDINFASRTESADSLSPLSYLIDWKLTMPSGATSEGWQCYNSGDFWRYTPGRLAEYHFADDPAPFAPGGVVQRGVQHRAQFVDLLPQIVQGRVDRMASDSSFVFTSTLRDARLIINGVERRDGYDAANFRYELDADSRLPLSVFIEANPGQPSEQSISAKYIYSADPMPDLTENGLRERYPDTFSRFRRDNYSLENLPGSSLPEMALRTLGGQDRYHHYSSDGFDSPTLVAILDSSVGSTADVVDKLKDAMAQMPFAANLILAFTDRNAEAISAIVGQYEADTTVLVGAKGFAADCGVADTPAFIFCGIDGKVADVMIGQNSDLTSVVIQKMNLSRQQNTDN